MKKSFHLVFCVCMLHFLPCSSFYIPGVAPMEYMEGDEVEIKVSL